MSFISIFYKIKFFFSLMLFSAYSVCAAQHQIHFQSTKAAGSNIILYLQRADCTEHIYVDYGDGNGKQEFEVSCYTPLQYIIQTKGFPITIYGKITHLYCGNSEITSLDVTQSPLLKELFCENNQLTDLDVSKNVSLEEFHFQGNKLKSINLGKNTNLHCIYANDNLLTALDLTANKKIKRVLCGNNKLRFKDFIIPKSSFEAYSVSPQAYIKLPEINDDGEIAIGDVIDLSQDNVGGKTVYQWWTKTGEQLIKGTHYVEDSPGVFTFLKDTNPEEVYCRMENSLFNFGSSRSILNTYAFHVPAKANQTITFPAPSQITYCDRNIKLLATASSGLPVTYQCTSSIASIDGFGNLSVNGIGTIKIRATQNGNSSYNKAPEVEVTIKIVKCPITVTMDPNQCKALGEPDPIFIYKVSPAATEFDEKYFTISRTPGETLGQYPYIFTIKAAQKAYIDAHYNYTFVNSKFTVGLQSQTITFNPSTQSYCDYSFQLVATAPSGLPIKFTTPDTSVLRIEGNTAYILKAGIARVTASMGGATLPCMTTAPDVTQTIKIDLCNIVVIPTPGQGKLPGEADPPTFTYTTNKPIKPGNITKGKLERAPGEDTGKYQFSSGTLTFGSNYNITSVSNEYFTIDKLEQIITFNQSTTYDYCYDAPFNLNAVVNSGLPLTYTSSNPSVISLVGNKATINGIGKTTITIYQPGNDRYKPTSISLEFTVNKCDVTVIPDPDQGKRESFPDPVITYTLNKKIRPADIALKTGALSRDKAGTPQGEVPGSYKINLGNLSYGPNYILKLSSQVFIIGPTSQTISWGNIWWTDRDYCAGEWILDAKSTSGLPITYTSKDTDIVKIKGDTAIIVGVGKVEIVASQPGDAYTKPATPVSLEFTIKPCVVWINPVPGQIVFEEPYNIKYSISAWKNPPESLKTGTLGRDAGTDPGNYNITLGNLSYGPNYELKLTPGFVTIPRVIELTTTKPLGQQVTMYVTTSLWGETVMIDPGDGNLQSHSVMGNMMIHINKVGEGKVKIYGNVTNFSLISQNVDSINTTKNNILKELILSGNELSDINLSKNLALTNLDVSSNKFDGIKLQKNTELVTLNVSSNNFATIDVSYLNKLQSLDCSKNILTDIKIPKADAFIKLYCSDNKLEKLDVSLNPKLKVLDCKNNVLKNLDMSKNIDLRELYCQNNKLTDLDIKNNNSLIKLYCHDNYLRYPHFKKVVENPFVEYKVTPQAIIMLPELNSEKKINIFNAIDLALDNVDGGAVYKVYKKSGEELQILVDFEVSHGKVKLLTTQTDSLYIDITHTSFNFDTEIAHLRTECFVVMGLRKIVFSSDFAKGSVIKFSFTSQDNKTVWLKEEGVESIEINSNGDITTYSYILNNRGASITLLGDVTHFWIDNQKLLTLITEDNELLVEISAKNNTISSLDFSKNPELEKLDFQSNIITGSINLSDKSKLTYTDFSDNKITAIDFTNSTSVKEAYFQKNQISGYFDFTPYTKLEKINFSENLLSGEYKFSTQPNLTEVRLAKNQISGTLDLAAVSKLKALEASDNKLEKILYNSIVRTNKLTTLQLANNKLRYPSFQPSLAINGNDYLLHPQAIIPIENLNEDGALACDSIVDLSIDAVDANVNYQWLYVDDNTPVSSSDYSTQSPGVFKFTEAQARQIYCKILNSGYNPIGVTTELLTERFTVLPRIKIPQNIIFDGANLNYCTETFNLVSLSDAILDGGRTITRYELTADSPTDVVTITQKTATTPAMFTINKTGKVKIRAVYQKVNDKYYFDAEKIAEFVIEECTITVVPNKNQSKVYGAKESEIKFTTQIPATTRTLTQIGTNKLTRESGENVGKYLILNDGIDYGTGFKVVVTEEYFQINKAPQFITFYVDPKRSYCEESFELNGTSSAGKLVTYSQDNQRPLKIEGQTAYIKSVGIVNVTASCDGDENYLPAENVSLRFVIDKCPVNIVPKPGQGKVYRDSDPEIMYDVDYSKIRDNAVIKGSLSRQKGEDVGSYPILIGSLTLGDNYTIILARERFQISKLCFDIEFENTELLYGYDFDFKVITKPAGVPLNITYNGSKQEPKEVGTYNVFVETSDTVNYCYKSAETIIVIKERHPLKIVSFIQPGTSSNRVVFRIKNPEEYDEITGLVLTDRQGRLIYQTDRYENETFSLENLTSGTYYYRIKYKVSSKTFYQSGYVEVAKEK